MDNRLRCLVTAALVAMLAIPAAAQTARAGREGSDPAAFARPATRHADVRLTERAEDDDTGTENQCSAGGSQESHQG